MAGSRLDKIGNLFSRMTGLLRTGAVKYNDRPVWYDVYRVFPPKYEPRYEREIEACPEPKEILYEEDRVRAKIFKHYGPNPGGMVRNLFEITDQDACQKFVNEYNSAKKSNPSLTEDELFEHVASTFVFPSTPYRRASSRRRRDPDGLEVHPRKTSVSTSEPVEMHQYEDSEVEVDTLNRQFRRKAKLITHDSLLALFKEASATADPAGTGKDGGLTETKKDDSKES